MAPDREIEGMVARRSSPAERARRQATLVLRAKTIRAYRRLLLDSDGSLTADAQVVLADLSRAAGLGKSRKGFTGEELNFFEGQRGLLLHIFARMDADALRQLADKMREQPTDD